ncbi:MAG: fibronectin type III domain-containing protein [Bacteroidales bacterium]|nr:fibronectin type III domain-containing protein [Bacteroidales bacterium]
MKKFLIPMMLSILLTTMGFAQTVVFKEDFENSAFSDSTWNFYYYSACNHWYIGSYTYCNSLIITRNQTEIEDSTKMQHSLYISSSSTGNNLNYNSHCSSASFAYTDITFGNLDQYVISFDVKSGGETQFDYVGVYLVDANTVIDGSAPSGIRLFTSDETNYRYWTHIDVEIPEEVRNTTKKLVIYWQTDDEDFSLFNMSAAIDNILITGSDCPRPTDLKIIEGDSTDVTLSWHENGNAISWTVYYREESDQYLSSIDSYNSFTTNDSICSFLQNGIVLTPGTKYEGYVVANCNSGESNRSNLLLFHTECTPINTLPYSENFNEDFYSPGMSWAFRDLPDCWNRLANPNSPPQTSYVGFNNGVDGLGGWRIMFGNSSYAILPPIDTNYFSINDLMISFDYGTYASDVEIAIGAMSNPYDETTFDTITTVTTSSQSQSTNGTWLDNFIVQLNSYTGNKRYIAFKSPARDASNIYLSNWYVTIDNVMINLIPDCPKPIYLGQKNIRSNSATIYFNDPSDSAASWQLEYTLKDDTTWTNSTLITITDTIYNLQELAPNSWYKWRVRTVCEDEFLGEWSDSSTFITLCSPIDTLPYIQDFELLGSNGFIECWNRIHIFEQTFGQVGAFRSSRGSWSSGTYTTDYYLYLNNGNAGNTVIAVLPEINSEYHYLGDLQVSFDLITGISQVNQYVILGAMTDPEDYTTFDSITMIGQMGGYNYTQRYTVSLSGYNGEGTYLAFRTPQYMGNNSAGIDNVEIIELPICAAPGSLQSGNITSNSADLSWVASNSGSFTLAYRPLGDTIWDTTTVISSSDNVTYTLTNLLPSTIYQWMVATNCSGEDSLSNFTPIQQFTTQCMPIQALPYVEDFSAEYLERGTQATSFINCWERYADPRANYMTTFLQAPATLNMQFGGLVSWAIMPQIDTPNIVMNEICVKLKAKGYSISGNANDMSFIEVGIVDNQNDTSSFNSIATMNFTNSQTWYDFVVPFYNYTGTGTFIAFRGSNVVIDSVIIDIPPECAAPVNLTVNYFDDENATLSWLPMNYGDQDFMLYYKEGNFSDSIEIHSDVSQYELSELQPSTNYTIWMKALCGEGTSADSSNVISFTTTMAPETLPYYVDFDNNYEENSWELMNCHENKWYIGTPQGREDNSLFVSYNGTNFSYDDEEASLALAVKTFIMPNSDSIRVSFDYIVNGEDEYDYLKILFAPTSLELSCDNRNASFASAYSNQYCLNGTWYFAEEGSSIHHYTATFANPGVGNLYNLAFLWYNDWSDGSNPPALIDNISVEMAGHIPSVISTFDPSNITTISATLNGKIERGSDTISYQGFKWGETSNENTYYYVYSPMDSNGNISANINALTPNTSYFVNAFAVINEDTVLGGTKIFNTLCIPDYITIDTTICQGQSYIAGNLNVSESGEYFDTLTNMYGCDSIIHINLDNILLYETTIEATIEEGETYSADGFNESSSGTYSLTLSTEEGCDSLVVLVLTVNSGIENITDNMNIALYPNPTKDNVTLNIDGLKKNILVSLTDVNGRTIKEYSMKESEKELNIEMKNLASGVYYLRIIADNDLLQTIKIIKEQ